MSDDMASSGAARRSTALAPVWSDDDDDLDQAPTLATGSGDELNDNANENPQVEEQAEPAADGNEATEGTANEKVTKRKSGLKRNIPKLDSERIKGPRGFPALPKLMENVKFKGKGHEASDLRLLMSHLEHWGHRLFPKATFDELLEKLEKLGRQKSVQNCLNRMRLGLPVTDAEYAAYVEREAEGDDVAETRDIYPAAGGDDNDRSDDGHPVTAPPATPHTPHTAASQPVSTSSMPSGLSLEQVERMRQSRLRALERRERLSCGVADPHERPRGVRMEDVEGDGRTTTTSSSNITSNSQDQGSDHIMSETVRTVINSLISQLVVDPQCADAMDIEEAVGREVRSPVSDRSMAAMEVGQDALQLIVDDTVT